MRSISAGGGAGLLFAFLLRRICIIICHPSELAIRILRPHPLATRVSRLLFCSTSLFAFYCRTGG
jgi:hypothetical protein